MADIELKTDEEKAEEIKLWWKNNGLSVVVGVLIAVAGVFGWNQWKQHKLIQSEEAAALYNKVAMDNNIAEQLKKNYSSTPYSALASLMVAKIAAEKGEDNKAINELKWVVDNASDNEVVMVARLRLSRLYIANDKLSDAHKMLSMTYPEAYSALVSELKGDLLVAKKEIKQAIASYDKAIRLSGGRAPEYLQMKRDSLSEGS